MAKDDQNQLENRVGRQWFITVVLMSVTVGKGENSVRAIILWYAGPT